MRHDLEDGLRTPVGALRRERARARRHIDQWHLVTAQRQARLIRAAGLGQRLHAHAPGDVDDPIDAGPHLDLDGGDVERIPEGEGDRLPAVVAAVIVARCVGAAIREPNLHRRIVDPGAHREAARLDRRAVSKDLEGGARLARNDGHVVLAPRHVGAG